MLASVRAFAASVVSAALLLGVGGSPALAKGGHQGPGPGPSSSSTTGNDISWPQCGGSYPSGQAFGIVGLTGGLANRLNSCFASELSWALGSSGGLTSVPLASLYVNTADPGQLISQVTDWPTNNVDPNNVDVAQLDPYGGGTCDGTDSPACSWQ